MKKRLLLYIEFVFLTVFFVSFSAERDVLSVEDTRDLLTIKNRLYQYSLAGEADVQAVRGFMEQIRADGSWPDINYQDKEKAGWEPLIHVQRLLAMAQAYRNPDCALFSDSELKGKAIDALDFWCAGNIKATAAWYNIIGVPKVVGPTLLLLEDELTPAQIDKGLYVLDFEVRYKNSRNLGHLRYWWNDGEAAGQNKLWLIRVRLFASLFRDQIDEIRNCFSSVCEELTVDRPQVRDILMGNEGVQADFSFHQHGPQLYSGGYGLGFAMDTAWFLGLSEGTQFTFPPEKRDFVLSYILDGQQWMIYRGVFDYSSIGRQISRQGNSSYGYQMLAASDWLSGLNLPRQQELQSFFERLRDDNPSSSLSGHRHFWCSDFSVHRREDCYLSIKMNSVRTMGTENGHGEGVKSYYLADGCTYILSQGDEYKDIFPVWDWTRIPGVTCEFTGEPPSFEPWGRLNGVVMARRGLGRFVGGVSDGRFGLAAMDYQSAGVQARKAWFCFDREVVCLGAGISCSTTNPVITSVNQCLLKGDIVTSMETAEVDECAFAAPFWALHRSIGYVFPDNSRGRLKTGVQKGSWHSINASRYPEKPMAKEVFSLWIDHGVQPENQTYSYIVVPNADPAVLQAYMENSPVEILNNTPQLQAVCNRSLGITQMVFYHAGEVALPDGALMRVDQPCLLMVRRSGDKLQVSVSNPENKPLTVCVETSMKLSGSDCAQSESTSVISFDLPDGPAAGQSLIKSLKIKN